MRKLIFAINTSLDGYCDHTKFRPDEETMAFFMQLTREADTFVYGRKTYQLMVPFWPDEAKKAAVQQGVHYEFARAFDDVKQIIVFSRTLTTPGWEKARIVHTDLKNEILRLKQESGKNILTGGVTIPAQLAGLGLIDEYYLVVHPVIVAEGKRLFEDIGLQANLPLKFVESTPFKSGVVVLRYVK